MAGRNKLGQFQKDSFIGEENYNWSGGKIVTFCRNCCRTILLHPSRIKVFLDKDVRPFCGIDCKGKWQSKNLIGEDNPHWKGGMITSKEGYVEVYAPSHHRAKQNGYVFEHILVAEKKYERDIRRDEHVHHLNGVKGDNNEDNLVVTTHKLHDKHSVVHALQERIRNLEADLADWKLT